MSNMAMEARKMSPDGLLSPIPPTPHKKKIKWNIIKFQKFYQKIIIKTKPIYRVRQISKIHYERILTRK